MIFKRKIYTEMLAWKEKSNGKTALLVEGARRIGKSTIVKEFAEKEYDNYILIDFAYAPKSIRNLFNDLSDINYFFLQIQLHYGVKLQERKSVIIFDEVQLLPLARQAIKILVKDGRYDYIETGSLISINKNVQNILIPSEEKIIQMHSMDFEEFLWAMGKEDIANILKESFYEHKSLGPSHRIMMKEIRLYMLIGGMPQSISSYLLENNFEIVDEVKRDIINLYEKDFYKIDNKGKISALYENIPTELNKHSAAYQISSVLPNDRLITVYEEIAELIASRTVIAGYNVFDPSIGLSNTYNNEKFRLYVSDTGLMVTMMYKDKNFTENIIYEKLLNDKLPTNLGNLYENLVAQMLYSNGHKIYYHTFNNEVQKRNYEIDFLIVQENKISPIEVKSSSYKAHKSLDVFCEKYSKRIKNKFVIHTKDFEKKDNCIYLPFYYIPFLK